MTKREAYSVLGIHNLDVSPEHLKDCYLFKMAEMQKHKNKKAFYDNATSQIEEAYEVILESRRKENWFCSEIDYREFLNCNPQEVKKYAPGQYGDYEIRQYEMDFNNTSFGSKLCKFIHIVLLVLGTLSAILLLCFIIFMFIV